MSIDQSSGHANTERNRRRIGSVRDRSCDDLADEDASHALQGRGVEIVVRGEDGSRETAGYHALADCDGVRRFLELLIPNKQESPS